MVGSDGEGVIFDGSSQGLAVGVGEMPLMNRQANDMRMLRARVEDPQAYALAPLHAQGLGRRVRFTVDRHEVVPWLVGPTPHAAHSPATPHPAHPPPQPPAAPHPTHPPPPPPT